MSSHSFRAWDAQSGAEIMRFKADKVIAFSSDGTRVLTLSEGSTLCLWDTESGKQIAILQGNAFWPSGAFSPNGKRIIAAFDDHAIHIWDSKNGKEIATLRGHTDNVKTAAFSQDSGRIPDANCPVVRSCNNFFGHR
jgi:WD40 repeat protein